jgi:hypothetical protein
VGKATAVAKFAGAEVLECNAHCRGLNAASTSSVDVTVDVVAVDVEVSVIYVVDITFDVVKASIEIVVKSPIIYVVVDAPFEILV